jgi:hypothetical protein
MIVYGGSSGSHDFVSDTLALDLQTLEWSNLTDATSKSRPTTTKSIPPRNFHQMAAVDGMLYVFGGNNEDGIMKDFWQSRIPHQLGSSEDAKSPKNAKNAKNAESCTTGTASKEDL